jgi:O-antigen/teichoic acid export membrane protein
MRRAAEARPRRVHDGGISLLSRISSACRTSLARNSVWMLLGQGSSVLMQAGYFVVIGRLLGTEGYGVIVGSIAAVSLLSQYSSLGSGSLLVQYVSRDRSLFASYWGSALTTLLGLSALVLPSLFALSGWMVGSANIHTLMIVAISEVICAQLCSLTSQAFQAHEQMGTAALLGMSTYFLRFVIAIGLWLRYGHVRPIVWAASAFVVSICAATAGVILVTRAFGPPALSVRCAVVRSRESIVYAFSNTTTSAYNDLDKAMLLHYGMSAANGVYSMAYRIVDVGTIPIRAIHSAAFPRFFQSGARGVSPVFTFARKILSRTWLLGSLAAVGMFVAAPIIPYLLGSSFASSATALRWLCLIPLFRAFNLSAGDALAGASHTKTRLCCQIGAALFNFALNLALIPRFGWLGAAWASLATDGGLGLIAWLVMYFLRHSERRAFSSSRSQEIATSDAANVEV